jgi:hypothetical protein
MFCVGHGREVVWGGEFQRDSGCVLQLTNLDPATLHGGPSVGVYVHGLFLDGAGWNGATLVESAPRQRPCALGVVWLHPRLLRSAPGGCAPTGDSGTPPSVCEIPVFRTHRRNAEPTVGRLRMCAAGRQCSRRFVFVLVCFYAQCHAHTVLKWCDTVYSTVCGVVQGWGADMELLRLALPIGSDVGLVHWQRRGIAVLCELVGDGQL